MATGALSRARVRARQIPIYNRSSSAFRTKWRGAVADERQHRMAMDAFHAEHVEPLNRAHDAGLATLAQVTEAESLYGSVVDAHDRALSRLLLTPAPGTQGLIAKLELSIRELVFDGRDESYAFARAMLSDARRAA